MVKNSLDLKGKKILVLGLGLHGGGAGTVRFLAKKGVRLTVTDLRPRKILRPTLKILNGLKNIHYVLGRHQKEDFLKSDLIVKNPGVKPNSPFLKIAKRGGVPITSDLGIFFKHCPGKIIGVTGTRGKSTTAHLIWRFLQEKFRKKNSLRTDLGLNRSRVFLGGNIRKSVFALLPKIKNKDWIILELSSFQLHDLAQEKQSPTIAVITNIFPDHLNWHKNFADYIKAKRNIFAFQKKDDYLFIRDDDRLLKKLTKKTSSRTVLVKTHLTKRLKKIVDQNLGRHYEPAVVLAMAVAKHFKVENGTMQKILKNFRGLEGRQKLIATIKGVRWINDTTSTIPEATIAAVDRFAKITPGRLILLAGGQDKKLDFRKLAQNIKTKVAGLILLPGTATEKLKKTLRIIHESDYRRLGSRQRNRLGKKQDKLRMIEVKSMAEAVKKAATLTKYGDLVILSPGAASFGLFANEFDRGKQFINAVNRLTKHKTPTTYH